MRLLSLAPVLLLPAVSSAAPPSIAPSAPQSGFDVAARAIDPNGPTRTDCPPISRYHASNRNGSLKVQKLNELPPGDHYKAVYRRIDGCEAPVIVSFGIGGR